MSYLYETHLHTDPSSSCGRTRGRDYIAVYQQQGYAGIMITDHFYRGNTGINRKLPWNAFVSRFCAGYESAAEEGYKRGFPVFFGWEDNFGGDEYLVYGLDAAFLRAHPEMTRWTRRQQFDTVHAAGGAVVQAHPFRQRGYIPHITLSTGCVHAVEIANGGNIPAFDALALRYARRLGLPMTAGGDIHIAEELTPQRRYGVMLEQPLRSAGDYATILRERRALTPEYPKGRCDWDSGALPLSMPCQIRDAADRIVSEDPESVL